MPTKYAALIKPIGTNVDEGSRAKLIALFDLESIMSKQSAQQEQAVLNYESFAQEVLHEVVGKLQTYNLIALDNNSKKLEDEIFIQSVAAGVYSENYDLKDWSSEIVLKPNKDITTKLISELTAGLNDMTSCITFKNIENIVTIKCTNEIVYSACIRILKEAGYVNQRFPGDYEAIKTENEEFIQALLANEFEIPEGDSSHERMTRGQFYITEMRKMITDFSDHITKVEGADNPLAFLLYPFLRELYKKGQPDLEIIDKGLALCESEGNAINHLIELVRVRNPEPCKVIFKKACEELLALVQQSQERGEASLSTPLACRP